MLASYDAASWGATGTAPSLRLRDFSDNLWVLNNLTIMALRPEHSAHTPLGNPQHKKRPLYLVLAYTSLGLGILGAFLPLLPTTPFLLLAAWSASRGSPQLHRWLYEHPRYGATLIAWEQERAVATSAKVTACVLMSFSWVVMVWMTSGWLVPAITGVLFTGMALFLISRPVPQQAKK